ncbi:hypothetical protein TWF730_000414 [Orbilia blumenaviensis]|uniref:ABM domain-containing protein n=1 Tax=Orbilia blumenaviensis TaxID=1796055 RepID=A0AAV9VPM8_9PEZI
MPITEICIFSLLPSTTVSSLLAPSSPHQSLLTTLRSQPGCQSLRWGVGTMDPLKLFWFIEWDTLTSHQTFQSTPTYSTFTTTALSLTNPSSNPPIQIRHYPLPTSIPSLLTQSSSSPSPKKPILEYFSIKTTTPPSNLSKTLTTLTDALKTHESDGTPIPATHAFAIDEGFEQECLALICWRDKIQHGEFLKTDVFRECAGSMQQLAAGPPVVDHVDLQEWE